AVGRGAGTADVGLERAGGDVAECSPAQLEQLDGGRNVLARERAQRLLAAKSGEKDGVVLRGGDDVICDCGHPAAQEARGDQKHTGETAPPVHGAVSCTSAPRIFQDPASWITTMSA